MKTHFNDIIIPLAWPENLTRTAFGKYDWFMSVLGLCKEGYYKVGHAACLVINISQGTVLYFDFGRYITPKSHGRIRSAETDPEILFDIKANIQHDQITNLEEILLYTASFPHTHGSGKMYATVHQNINFHSAINYIRKAQSKAKFLPYGPFVRNGTNCSRFVAQTIANASPRFDWKFLYPWYGTPSPVGNLFACNHPYYYIVDTTIKKYHQPNSKRQRFKILKSLMLVSKAEIKLHIQNKTNLGTLEPPHESEHPTKQWLGGIGAGAWHEIIEQKNQQVRFKRTQASGFVDCDRWLKTDIQSFDYQQPFQFMHGTVCNRLIIQQKGTEFLFQ